MTLLKPEKYHACFKKQRLKLYYLPNSQALAKVIKMEGIKARDTTENKR